MILKGPDATPHLIKSGNCKCHQLKQEQIQRVQIFNTRLHASFFIVSHKILKLVS